MAVELEMEKGIPTVRERSIDLYYKGYSVGRGQVTVEKLDKESTNCTDKDLKKGNQNRITNLSSIRRCSRI